MKPGPDKQFDPEVALRAAIEVFRERGYEGASLSQLTSAMGIGKKSLYDTFGNKRSLFLQAIQHYGEEAIRMIREQLESGRSPLNGFRQLFKVLEQAAAEPCSKGCMIAANLGDFDQDDDDVAKILAKVLKAQENLFHQQLEKAAKEGELDPKVRTRPTARMLISLAQGNSLIGRITPGREPSRSTYAEALRRLQAP